MMRLNLRFIPVIIISSMLFGCAGFFSGKIPLTKTNKMKISGTKLIVANETDPVKFDLVSPGNNIVEAHILNRHLLSRFKTTLNQRLSLIPWLKLNPNLKDAHRNTRLLATNEYLFNNGFSNFSIRTQIKIFLENNESQQTRKPIYNNRFIYQYSVPERFITTDNSSAISDFLFSNNSKNLYDIVQMAAKTIANSIAFDLTSKKSSKKPETVYFNAFGDLCLKGNIIKRSLNRVLIRIGDGTGELYSVPTTAVGCVAIE